MQLCVYTIRKLERVAAWWSSRKFDGMINQCPREIWRQDLLKSRVGDPSATNRSLVTVITAFLRQYIHTASLPINLSSRLSSPRVLSSTGRVRFVRLHPVEFARSPCSYIVRKLISLLVILFSDRIYFWKGWCLISLFY